MRNIPAAALLVASLFVGCVAKKPVVPPSTPISEDQLQSMRAEFATSDANTRLAAVVEVLPGEDYARLGQTTPADFPVGTIVSIIDSNRNVLANGTVVVSEEGRIDVQFEVSGPRRPQVGDVAVRF